MMSERSLLREVEYLRRENAQWRKTANDYKRLYVELWDTLSETGMDPQVLIETHRAFK